MRQYDARTWNRMGGDDDISTLSSLALTPNDKHYGRITMTDKNCSCESMIHADTDTTSGINTTTATSIAGDTKALKELVTDNIKKYNYCNNETHEDFEGSITNDDNNSHHCGIGSMSNARDNDLNDKAMIDTTTMTNKIVKFLQISYV
jgi:hypothetical protein